MVMIPFLFNAGLIPVYLVVNKLGLVDYVVGGHLARRHQHL